MNSSPLRILCIEDNRADAALIQGLLEGNQATVFEVTWVDRLQKAIDLLRQSQFDAILLDLSLPDTQGLPTLERLQQENQRTPIIIVTGLEDEELGILAIRHGAQDYLVKGAVDGRAIARAIHYAIDRKRKEEQLNKLNRALNALGHSSQAMIRAKSEGEFLKEACKIIVQDCGYAMVWIGFAEDDENKTIRPVAFAGFEDGYLDALKLTWADTKRGRGPTGKAVRTGKVCRCLNMLEDPMFLPWREEARKRGYASSISLPLLSNGKALGALTIYAREPIGFVDEEVMLLSELASDFTSGINVFRIRNGKEQAERALRESELRYRTLFTTMTEGFALHEIILDSKGTPYDYRFLDINPVFEHQMGLKRREIIGKTAREIFPGVEPVWVERYGRVVQTGKPDHFEHHSSDFGRHYDVTAYCTEPGRFAVIFDETSELKALQKREKEDAIRLAWGQSALDTINAMGEGVVLLELDGTITSVNPAAEVITGLAGGETVGRNIETFLPSFLGGDDLRTAIHGLAKLRRGNIPKFLPLNLTRPDGTVVHVLPSVSLMATPEDGHRLAVLTLKDVTELHEATYQLKQSELRYRELVENANSIIMRITPDHDITFFNEYAQKFFGYDLGEILNKSVIGTIAPEVDSEGRDLRKMIRDISEYPELHAVNDNENMRKDGSRVWVHWSNRAVRDHQGKLVELLCVGTDITKRREMEAQARLYQQRLRELTERLAVAEEEDRWRISRYIHDTIIQNLSLSSIRLATVMKSLTDATLPDEAEKLRQIRRLLDDAVDECRMVMSDLTPALLYELGLIPALHDLAQQVDAKYGARMKVEDDGQEKPMSNPLRGLLFQAVRELIMNSMKHAGPCDVSVSASCLSKELVIRVKDNGCGFDSCKLNESPNQQGGFGLFNIRRRIEGLGGRLEIDSTPGCGTTATICVPMR